MGHFGPQNDVLSQLRICSKDFFDILHSERSQEVLGNYGNGFSEKNSLLGQVGHFWPENGTPS